MRSARPESAGLAQGSLHLPEALKRLPKLSRLVNVCHNCMITRRDHTHCRAVMFLRTVKRGTRCSTEVGLPLRG